MHAVVVTVSVEAGQIERAQQALRQEVVPRVSKAPGFVKGYWTVRPDTADGLSFVVFRTKEDADGAAKMVRSSPTPPGVTMSAVEVREIVAEA